MLKLRERFDLRAMGHNSIDYIRTIAEVQKYATVDKDKFLGDPAFVDIPLGRFLDEDVVEARYASIRGGENVTVTGINAGQTSKDTTHISVVAKKGKANTMKQPLAI